jgi:hypothetical protein
MVDNAFIRAVDAKGKEIAKFSLSNRCYFKWNVFNGFWRNVSTQVEIGNLEL